MKVSSAPGEATSGQTPRFSRANAFRVLQVPADAELRAIYRQQQRLLVAIEIGGLEGTKPYGLPPLGHVSKEEILDAVHLLERPEDRLIEDLFWVHEMDGLIDEQRHNVLAVLRWSAAGTTTRSAVARHNLAVMHTILGQECAENRGLGHWKEALKTWKELMDDGLFWAFMKDRALRINCQKWELGMMKAAVSRELSSRLSEEMVGAAKSGELTAVAVLATIAMEHRSWLEFEAAFRFAGQQSVKSTEEGETEIKVTGELHQRARESMERDSQQVQQATLCWEAYALVQKGDFAAAERRLADALTISTEEHRPTIKAMRARCRWTRVQRRVDA
jgi:hypothetical protein